MSPDLEDRYRTYQRPADRTVIRAAAVVCAPALFLFASADYHFFGTAWPFPLLLALRIVLAGYTLSLALLVDRISNWRVQDRLIFTQLMMLVCFQLIVSWSRPPDFVGYLVKDIVVNLIIFTIAPLPVRGQMIPTLGLLAGDVVIGGLIPSVSSTPGLGPVAIISAVLTWCVGLFVSLQTSRQKRLLFYAGVLQANLTGDLETALNEIRTLRGIVPICAHCKMIRDEKGIWHPVEVYIRQNSHAEFSHGVCPGCAQEYYGQVNLESAVGE